MTREEQPPKALDKLPPETLESVLDHAELALDNGDANGALETLEEVLKLDPRQPDALFLVGECQQDLGRPDLAIEAYKHCVLVDGHHAGAWASLGMMHLVEMRYDEASRAFNRSILEDQSFPEAWYGRAVLRERKGDFRGADRDLARAARLDSEEFPFPIMMGDEEVDKVVEEAISALHPTIKEYLGNVDILLDEVPSDDILRLYDPPADPGELLGYFSGYSLMERSADNPWSQFPPVIILFRRNLQRHARNREHLIDELRTTFYHEVGHFLGLDEADLEERGLE